MKTSQVLIRRMGDFEVLQRTSDGMFNATILLKQWNTYSGQKKDVAHYFENNTTDEFINALMSDENFTSRNSVYVKSKASRGQNAGTWMHPLLFIDFAMWLNPSFKVKVLRFVYDQLIEYRNEAGDSYRIMTSALSKIVDRSILTTAIRDIAKAINYIVFNNHEPLLRNKQADEGCMRELCELQKDIAKLVDFGFIKTIESLKVHLRERWSNKWQSGLLDI